MVNPASQYSEVEQNAYFYLSVSSEVELEIEVW